MRHLAWLLLFASLVNAQTLDERVTASQVQPTPDQILIQDLNLDRKNGQAPLQAKIDALTAQVANLTAQLATANGTIATQTKTITTRNTTISTLNKQIATLNSQIAALNATITSLRTQLATWPAACPAATPCPVCAACPTPPAPPVVTNPPAPTGTAVLLWDPVAGATGYRVYFGNVASRLYDQPIGQGLLTTATTYTATNLLPLARYYFAVTAQNDLAESSFSNEVILDAGLPPDTQAPTVPTGLVGVAVSPTQINLTWNASKDNVQVTGYLVYNADIGSALNGAVLATVTGTSYTHSGLLPGSTHSYRVSAFDAVPNHSGWFPATGADPISVTTPLQ